MTTYHSILKGLKTEINETLFFFLQSDFNIYGFITKGTEEAFETQKIEIPASLLPYRHKNQPLSEKGLKLQNDLRHFTGCEQPYKHPLFKSLIYTDGVQYLAKEAQSYWLLDIIGSILNKIKEKEFATIKLKVYRLGNGETKALFTADDGNDNIFYRQTIEYTDFPLDEIKFFYTNDILILPSEY